MVFPSQGELCPHRAFTGSMRATEMEIEHDDTEPTQKTGRPNRPPRKTGRRPRPQVARKTRAEFQSEVETAAARTLADLRPSAEAGTAGAGEAAVEGGGVIE